MDDQIERLARLRFAKEASSINDTAEQEQQRAVGDLNRRGVFMSGMTVKMLIDTELGRHRQLAVAYYTSMKEAHVLTGTAPSPDQLRMLGKSALADVLDNAATRIAERIASKYPALTHNFPWLAESVESEVDRLKAQFRDQVELEATENEVRLAGIERTGEASSLESMRLTYDVFISFTTADCDTVDRIRNLLVSKGVRVFYSQHDLESGDEWSERIRSALISSREICLVCSNASMQREWVLTEWGTAWALGRRITPILVDIELSSLPQRLQQKQCVAIADLDSYVEDVARRGTIMREDDLP